MNSCVYRWLGIALVRLLFLIPSLQSFFPSITACLFVILIWLLSCTKRGAEKRFSQVLFNNDKTFLFHLFSGLFGSNNCFHCGSNGIDKQLFASGWNIGFACWPRSPIHTFGSNLFELGCKIICWYGNVFRCLRTHKLLHRKLLSRATKFCGIM